MTTASLARRDQRGYLPFLLPVTIGMAVIVILPLALNVWFSLFNWKGGLAPFRWVGLANYAALLTDEQFWTSFRNTIAMITAIVVIPTALGLLIAAVLFDFVGRRFGTRTASFLRATYYLPQVLPIAVVGILWNWVLGSRGGAINTFLNGLGIENPPNWLGQPGLALASVMLVLIWAQIGFPVVILMGALQRVDPALYEAAALDGAGWAARFRAITVPQVRPEIFVVSLTGTIAALKVFAPILVLTDGGPESSTYVPSYYSFLNFFSLSKVGYGAAIANVLTLLILAVAAVMLWAQRRHDEAE